MTITSLTDDVHGDLNGQGTCAVPQTIQPGDTYTCAFSAFVAGNAGDTETDVVTASGTDDDGAPVTDSDDATVTVTGVAPAITVTKTASPSTVPEPGGDVTFTVVVDNTQWHDRSSDDHLVDRRRARGSEWAGDVCGAADDPARRQLLMFVQRVRGRERRG